MQKFFTRCCLSIISISCVTIASHPMLIRPAARRLQSITNKFSKKPALKKSRHTRIAAELHAQAIYAACSNGQFAKVWDILYEGFDVNHNFGHSTLLHIALHTPDAPGNVAKLIAFGADVNALSDIFGTPLHIAAMVGNTLCAHILISRGAAINRHDLSKNTPLHIAAKHGHKEMIALLLKHGANTTALNIDKRTPADIAHDNDHQDIAHMLE